MSKVIVKSSVFPDGSEAIWEKLQSLSSLQYVAAPFASFEPADGRNDLLWSCGETFRFRLRLFGLLPFGIHTIRIVTFDRETLTIYSNESNPHVPVWNHRISLKPIDKNHTQYMDEVEIDAGWKTVFVCLWARLFYAHRQRKWKKLLKYGISV